MVTRINQRTDSDCLRASIAAAFDLNYDVVPDFGNQHEETPERSRGWAQECELNEWLAKRGLGFIRLPNPTLAMERGAKSARLPWGICIGEGKSPRGDWDHCVVCDARGSGANAIIPIIHDPHPSRDGLKGPTESFVCFTVEDPGVLV